jgi:bisanhydrobacterioruberin hydratase
MMVRIYRGIYSTLYLYSIQLLVIIHVAGIIGLLSPLQEYFRLLTPFNLLVSGFLLWLNHHDRSRSFMIFAGSVIVLGFLVEVIGVQTGLIFGSYSYGATLGPKFLGVPVIIGLNWLLIIYSIGVLTGSIAMPSWMRILLGAALAVSIDMLIEPVAIHYDFWSWGGGDVPYRNYLGWFITSVIMLTLFRMFKVKAENKVALPYYFIQLFFFLILFSLKV